ncbi:MAG: hypothetical protein A2075_25180 [Geobacteraceae bacterium GWC2_58_44]|nr:MAG: hypothetical protein A2075_25180 [Geobacteraceae bacterium GWC2_58_44]HBG05345.1 hypothetical protein [Geobacter sp.]
MRPISRLALLLIILSVLPAQARSRTSPTQSKSSSTSEQEVLRGFEQILDLWRDGRYDELFEKTADGKEGRELFAKKLASAPRRPACCWEKMQDARVSLKGERAAVVRARLGFEGSLPGTVFVTRGIKLKKEEGFWTISQSELYSLANVSKKRTVYKYLPIQGK